MEPSTYPMSSTESLSVELQVHVARGFMGRLRGLIGRGVPAPGCALLLPGVRAVHAVGMRITIDVLFLDGRGCIVRMASLAPAQVASCAAARHVLEMKSGEVARLGLQPAMRPRLLLLDDIFDEARRRGSPNQLQSACRTARRKCFLKAAFVAGILLTVTAVAGSAEGAPPGELDAAVISAPRLERATPSGVTTRSSKGADGGTSSDPIVPGGRRHRGSTALPARPIPIETLQRLEEEAEIVYRENRRESDEALIEVYETLAELAPDRFPRAWLRIGNIRQRSGRPGEAVDAYRRVRGPAEERKALLNLTALTLEEARQALARLDALPAAASTRTGAEPHESLPGERGEHALIGDLRRQLQAAEQHLMERQQRRPDAAAAERDTDGTHMIERYTASARRNAVKAARGSLHADPADESIARPVPPPRPRPAAESLPSIEYLLGDPLRSRQNGAAEGEASASGGARNRDAGRAASAGEVGGRAVEAGKGGPQK